LWVCQPVIWVYLQGIFISCADLINDWSLKSYHSKAIFSEWLNIAATSSSYLQLFWSQKRSYVVSFLSTDCACLSGSGPGSAVLARREAAHEECVSNFTSLLFFMMLVLLLYIFCCCVITVIGANQILYLKMAFIISLRR